MASEWLEKQSEQDGWLKFGVAAELSKKYAADQRDFFSMLALLLEGALPEETTIERRGGLFTKKTLHRIIITLGDNRYTIEDPGRGSLIATRTHIVRGIALKTETVAIPEWIDELAAALNERAQTSQAAREALERITG
jgi:hypothetical protein